MVTFVTILGGLLTILTAGYPLYRKIMKDRNEKKNITIAHDDNRRVAFRERMRNRIPKQRGKTNGEEPSDV